MAVKGMPHGEYLRSHLSGLTLIVARDSERLDQLSNFAENVPAVTSVRAVQNQTHDSQTVEQHEIGVPKDKQFDTIVYAKEASSWFSRSKDFHRFTGNRLALGGTLLGKTKWIPDSNRVELDEIVLVDPLGFTPPDVYLRWSKVASQQTLTGPTIGPASNGGSIAAGSTDTTDADDTAPEDRPLDSVDTVDRARQLQSQFDTDTVKTEYTPGWSWHGELIEHVRSRIDDIEGPVANLCCGSNPLGDIRIDQLREYDIENPDSDNNVETALTAATIQADATTVPLQTNSVSAVVTDPPWKIQPEQRVHLFSEAVRIVEPGGRVIINAWWLPNHPYTTVAEPIRAVTANVTDDSIHGPGGLSFLAEYEVAEHPSHNWAEYTLSDHMERVGVDGLRAYFNMGWQQPHPLDDPRLDPRIMAGPTTGCEKCDCESYTVCTVHGSPLYECCNCGFRHSACELLS